MESLKIASVATRDGYEYFQTKLDLEKATRIAEEEKLSLRFFHYSNSGTSFLLNESESTRMKDRLRVLGEEFESVSAVSIVSVVGDGVASSVDLVPQTLKGVRECDAQVLLVCSNALSLTVAVPSSQKKAVANRLHEILIEKKTDKKKEPPAKGAPKFGGEDHLSLN